MNPLLEHAARVLDHQPTRSMSAEALYRRARRESGVELPYTRFLEAVRERTQDFVVITPNPMVGCDGGWDPRQRSRYEAALDAAGLRQPLVVRTEVVDETAIDPMRDASGRSDLVADVHASLTSLLRTCDPDDPMRNSVEDALDGLRLIDHALRS